MKSLKVIAMFILSVHFISVHGQIGWEWAYAEKASLESQGEGVCFLRINVPDQTFFTRKLLKL